MVAQVKGTGNSVLPGVELATPLSTADGGSRLAQAPVYFQTGEVVAPAGVAIPFDDSIPQITEGALLLTSPPITPTSIDSILEIEVISYVALINSAVNLTGALFRDSTVNAVGVCQDQISNANAIQPQILRARVVAGSLEPTTFTFRSGTSAAHLVTMNGYGGSRLMGGAMVSSITIKEYLP